MDGRTENSLLIGKIMDCVVQATITLLLDKSDNRIMGVLMPVSRELGLPLKVNRELGFGS